MFRLSIHLYSMWIPNQILQSARMKKICDRRDYETVSRATIYIQYMMTDSLCFYEQSSMHTQKRLRMSTQPTQHACVCN